MRVLSKLPILGLTAMVYLSGAEPPTGERYDRNTAKTKYIRPAAVPDPPGNRMTAERVQLGKALFFDPRLSGSGLISCGSCHNPSFAWGDGMARAVGWQMKQLDRRTPTILNTGWAESLFWDGRAGSLEEQALGPIGSADEMNGGPIETVIPKLVAIRGYRDGFARAYPGEGISKESIAKAIASFERTVISARAPFDDWIAGREPAISESAKRGFDLFNTKANCAKCHTGWNFTDDGFHDLGISRTDPGRGKFLPQKADSQFTFKTPTLRNVVERAPYMHDGSVTTLDAVIDLYDKGPEVKRESISPDFLKLNLTVAEKRDLMAFLHTLSSLDPAVEFPRLPLP